MNQNIDPETVCPFFSVQKYEFYKLIKTIRKINQL